MNFSFPFFYYLDLLGQIMCLLIRKRNYDLSVTVFSSNELKNLCKKEIVSSQMYFTSM